MHKLFQLSIQSLAFWVTISAWIIISVRSGRGHESKERNTTGIRSDVFLLLGTEGAMIAAFVLKLTMPNATLYSLPAFFWLGLGMVVCGTVLRQIAIRTLGAYHVLTIATQDKQPVVTSGIYRIIRHPSYLGAMGAVAGFALSLNCLVGSIGLVVLNIAALIYRIQLEDVYLIDHLGSPYEAYAKHTARIVPFVW